MCLILPSIKTNLETVFFVLTSVLIEELRKTSHHLTANIPILP